MHSDSIGIGTLCEALGEPRASWYRWSKSLSCTEHQQKSMPSSPRKLTAEDEERILDTLNSERFCDMAPGEVYASLLDEGIYLCSERTMYRILERKNENLQRRQTAPKNYAKPELLATRPKELWSWDITKLKGPAKWTYYYLYKVIDVFSRFIVGWTVAFKESAQLAQELIGETCLKQEIIPGQLTIHADNGSSMTSLGVGQLLTDLGITKTHSRPHTSNDNPYSEAAFKTLKYRPDFPERFMSIEEARTFCKSFFQWYNYEHHHSGIAMLTPASVHYDTYQQILEKRSIVLVEAYMKHPERFVKGISDVKLLPQEVWINKPEKKPSEVLAKH